MPSAPSARQGADSTVGPMYLIAALAAELGCLPTRRDRAWAATRCGPGPASAAAAARAAVQAGAGGLLLWGFAGGLAEHLACGAIVLPRQVRGSDGRRYATDSGWRARLAAALPAGVAAEAGDLACVDRVATTPAAKRQIQAATGAVALDMESAAVAAVALEAGIPFVVLKVVIDGPNDALPPGVERWVDRGGRARWVPWLGVMLRPSDWPAVCLLLRRYRVARARLCALARLCGPRGFLLAAAPVGS